MSGGIDSAVVAAIAADAIGGENVYGVGAAQRVLLRALAGRRRSSWPTGSARTSQMVPIAPMVTAFVESLKLTGLAEENVQARVRGTTLMGLSNQHGHLVLATGNKSELSVGYSTIYGDAVGGFAPIKDVPKTLVWQLARWRNAEAAAARRDRRRSRRTRSASRRRPSCGRASWTRDSLPDYDELDRRAGRATSTPTPASPTCWPPASTRSWWPGWSRLTDAAEWKRRQYPPGPKISLKAFGRDRRLPITNRWREHAADDGAGRPSTQVTAALARCIPGRHGSTMDASIYPPGDRPSRPRGNQRTTTMSETLYGGSVHPPGHHPRPAERQGWPATAGRCSPPTTTPPPGSSTQAGVPVLLVGDSAANVVYGYDTTVPVTVDELLPLVRGVVRGASRALVVADLPFGSYQASPQQALETATRFLKEGGAQAVKLEGGARMAPAGRAADLGRHPGDGAHRPDPAVGEHPVRLPGAGPRRRGRPPAARRRPRAAGRRRVRRGAGGGAGRPGQEDHPRAARSRPSASAPASSATPRCWSGRTWPACAPAASRPSSSSSTPT